MIETRQSSAGGSPADEIAPPWGGVPVRPGTVLCAQRALAVLVVLFASGAVARAQDCKEKCVLEEDLKEPCMIPAVKGVLDTKLSIELKDQKVPVWEYDPVEEKWNCCMEPMRLRSFVSPSPHCQRYYAQPQRWLPGPTLQVSKPATEGGRGDRIKVLLVNKDLGPDSDHQCNPCDCTQTPKPKCCGQTSSFKDTYPNCFHGNNTTNLHFHGTHVSPQSPQDYVLLELEPGKSATAQASQAHGLDTIAKGQFQYDVDPLRYTQPDGTHWYHPHKHGSAALQVGSGMAGALIVRGSFDKWLFDNYRFQEKILVLQQVHLENNFGKSGAAAPQPLINGQATPKIKMFPGQIQRWRLIGATMEGGAQLAIRFTGALKARQIAMDGVQFAPLNYKNQPLLPQDVEQLLLSPGNRFDLLVRAPTTLGRFSVTYEVVGSVEGEERKAALTSLRNFLLKKNAAGPSLLTVEVVRPCPSCKPMEFPDWEKWPPMPDYLSNIPATPNQRRLWFRLEGADGKDVGPATQPSKFFINFDRDKNQQYDPSCIPITATLGDTEEWTIYNTTRRSNGQPFHVFHIHTNPYQVVETWGLKTAGTGTDKDVCAKVTYDPPIWQDSLTLPSACREKAGADPTPGYVKIRQRYEGFTGAMVLHCHFLGHEDRGMMLGVQIVCPKMHPGDPDFFGTPVLRGDECKGKLEPAIRRCPGT